MITHFPLHIVSPSSTVFDARVSMVEVPGLEGDFGVLPGHAPFFSMLRPGVITLHLVDQAKLRYFATSGYADVSPAGCTILSEHVQNLDEISLADAEAALAATEKDVADATDDKARASALKRVSAAKTLLAAIRG
jgi:F-type H+-transporting ATPase subunit epsilon